MRRHEVLPDAKKQRVKELKSLMKDCSEIYLATDEDREGESISWHLLDVLKPKVPVKRLVFHEITKAAIKHSLENSRDIDINPKPGPLLFLDLLRNLGGIVREITYMAI